MKKILILLVLLAFGMASSVCQAAGFVLDRTVWNNFASVNEMEIFYNKTSIKKDGDKAKVWLCYHYLDSDSFRLILREYTRGVATVSTLKTIDYYSDGSFKKGTTQSFYNLKPGINEDQIIKEIW